MVPPKVIDWKRHSLMSKIVCKDSSERWTMYPIKAFTIPLAFALLNNNSKRDTNKICQDTWSQTQFVPASSLQNRAALIAYPSIWRRWQNNGRQTSMSSVTEECSSINFIIKSSFWFFHNIERFQKVSDFVFLSPIYHHHHAQCRDHRTFQYLCITWCDFFAKKLCKTATLLYFWRKANAAIIKLHVLNKVQSFFGMLIFTMMQLW